MPDSPVVAPVRTRAVGTVVHLALGLGLVGVAGYGFIAIVGRVFAGPVDAAILGALTSVYLLINVLGPGAFAAVEQETSRAVSAARAAGVSALPPARRAGLLTAGLFVGVAVLAVVMWPVFLGQVLDYRLGLLGAVLLAAAGFALMYWVRGVLSGQQRLGAYGASLYLEGLARLAPCLLLLVAAVRSPDAYGAAFAAGSVLAGLLLLPGLGLRDGRADGPAPRDMGTSLAMLVAAGLCMQLVANLAPVIVTFRLPGDLVGAAVFGLTFVLARIPLFLFSPVQALLVPALTRAVTTGRTDQARRLLGRTLAGVLVVGAVGCVVAATVGPWAVTVLFNAAQRPAPLTLGLLGLATVAMMVALTLQSALVAVGRQSVVTLAWAAGTVVFVGLLFLPGHPIDAALTAQLAGPTTTVVCAAVGLRRALRSRSIPTSP